jgi:D-amino peptidase
MTGHKRVFISCDIEGITGVIGRDQSGPTGKDYERARAAMTADTNAAIEGALAAGAGLVVVSDGHGSMQNLILEQLNPAAEAVLGSPKPLTQMEGISSEFDVALFVGYHARMGSPGVLSHTISGSVVANVWVNGILVGETGINAVLAGRFGVPVGLVTGDQCVCAEARELLGKVETAEVKHAITRYSARCLHPDRSHTLIRAAAHAAVEGCGGLQPFTVGRPVTFRLQFKDTGMTDSAVRVPKSVRVDPLTLEITDEDAARAFIGMRAMIGLAQA